MAPVRVENPQMPVATTTTCYLQRFYTTKTQLGHLEVTPDVSPAPKACF
jgi:hypothetical protein